MAELELKDITLRFGGLAVLNSISLSVEKSELLALIGPNGAGKTSVFNCISGIYVPDGEIHFRGANICGLPPHRIARLGISRTFQHAELFPDMTVIDNVMTGLHARIETNVLLDMLKLPTARRREEEIRAKATENSRFCRVAEQNRYDGEHAALRGAKDRRFRPRLGGVADAVLLDEPSAGLTREEREDLAYYILKTKENLGIGIIWIEHDMQMVADLADRIHVLDYGSTLADGTPDFVLRQESVVQAFWERQIP